MIHIDLFFTIATFLFVTILLVIGHWIFYTYKEEQPSTNEVKNLLQCPYCTYLFFDYEESVLRICPRCESYITVSEVNNISKANHQNKGIAK